MLIVVVLLCFSGCGKQISTVGTTDEIIVENNFGIYKMPKEENIPIDIGDEEKRQEVVDIPEDELESGHIAEDLLPKESVDLIFFMGQSNMSGTGGDASKTPEVSVEAGEEFRAFSDKTRLYPIEEPFGKNESNPDGLEEKKDGKNGSLVSSFINEYHELTNHKVIAVSISVGGMAMDIWLKEQFFNDAKTRINESLRYLDENGYRAENTFIIWLQGESDAIHQKEPEVYRQEFESFMTALMDEGVEHVFIITPGRMLQDKNAYNTIIEMQKRICEENDYCSLATDCLGEFDTSYMKDEFHYNQEALNITGREAAEGVYNYLSLQP